MEDTKHRMVSDLKRVASELGTVPRRDQYFYEKLGQFSERAVKGEFGTYTDFVKAAGFKPPKEKPSREEKKFEREVDNHEKAKRLMEKFHEELAPWFGKYKPKPKESMTILVGSDFHSQWMDPFAFHVFKETAKRMQPDVIALAGDVFDFYQVSAFSKNPRRAMSLQSELNYIKTHLFAPLREACPDSTIDLFIGNHEWRLFKYLCEAAPALASLDCLRFDELFELEKYRINLVARESFLNARKATDFENYKIYGKSFVITHGIAVGQNHADVELRKWGMSGASGHVHHFQVQSKRDLHGDKTWTSLGCMCQLKSGEEYIHDLVRWNQGFLRVMIHQDRVVTDYIQLQDGFAVVDGIFYQDPKKKP